MSQEDCFICSEPAPRPALVCMICFESASTDTRITIATPHDCSTRCKTSDIHKHGSAGIDNGLSRAADILQASYHLWRELTFDLKIKAVEKVEGILDAYEDYYKPKMLDDVCFDFPNQMVPDWRDKAALLTYSACDDAVGYMFEFSKMLLQNLTTVIDEWHADIDSSHWVIKRYFGNGIQDTTKYKHNTLMVKATNGESYVIDMTGSQVGQHRAVVPAQEYVDRFAAKNAGFRPHGSQASEMEKRRKTRAPVEGNYAAKEIGGKYDYRTREVEGELLKYFYKGVRKFEETHKMKAQKILSCQEVQYQELKASLLMRIKREMEIAMAAWELDGYKIKEPS